MTAAALLGACGGSDEPKDVGGDAGRYAGPGITKLRYEYPPAVVRDFVASCASSSSQRAVCRCTIERLQSTLPHREFAAADRAARAGRPVPARTRAAIGEATEACRE